MGKMTRSEINGRFNKGINCPVCGKQLIDLQHDGYEGGNPNLHEYWCDNCDIDFTIIVN